MADALAGLHLVDATAGDIVDVGSGTGVPGLVLALVRPERAIHLVESVQKKAAVLAAHRRRTGRSTTLTSGPNVPRTSAAAPTATGSASPSAGRWRRRRWPSSSACRWCGPAAGS